VNAADEDFWSVYYDKPAEPWPFAVRSVGYNRYGANHQRPMLKHPYHHWVDETSGRLLDTLTLVHVTLGRGVFRSKPSGRLTARAGSVFFVFPNVRHYYRYDSAIGWDDEWVEVDAAGMIPLLAARGVDPQHPMLTFDEVSPCLRNAFARLFDLARLKASPDALSLAAHGVFSEALALGREQQSAPEVCLKKRLEAGDVRITEAMEGLGVSPTKMRLLFKARFGMSPKDFELKTRLDRAAQLLRHSTSVMAEIATAVGFDSPESFSRRFRRYSGMAPSEFRSVK